MNHYFDLYVNEHLQEILCKTYKEHALSPLRKSVLGKRSKQDKLQDSAIYPSLSQSQP
jgi:hypothetical protein